MLTILELLLALTTTLPALRAVRRLLTPGDGSRSWCARLVRLSVAYAAAGTITLIQLGITHAAVTGLVLGAYLLLSPEVRATFDAQKFFKSKDPSNQMVMGIMNSITIFLTVLLDRPFLGSFAEISGQFSVMRYLLRVRLTLTRTIIRIGST